MCFPCTVKIAPRRASDSAIVPRFGSPSGAFDVSWEAFLNAGGPQGEGAMFKGTRVGWESWFMGQIREIRKAGKKRKLEESIISKYRV